MLRHLARLVGFAAPCLAVLSGSGLPVSGVEGSFGGLQPRAPYDPYQVVPICTAFPVNIGRQIHVSNGEELQRALDSAMAGDTILLAAGATFYPVASGGSFVLRNLPIPNGQVVVVRSSSPAFNVDGAIPPNTRVGPSNAALMPQLRVNGGDVPAIRTDSGAHGYRLVGLDVGPDPANSQVTNLIMFGAGNDDTSVTAEPSDITIDRCYVHGSDRGNFRRGVLMNGAHLAVIESYLENFHDENGDSQAVNSANGPGPMKIVNNFLEAASENIMFGGADPSVPDLVPSNIEIRRNLITKRLSWLTAGLPVKNALELKNARRLLVEGNILENVWVSAQVGRAVLMWSFNQGGHCPWCVTEFVTFRNNIVRGAASAIAIAAAMADLGPLPIAANHIRVDNVLFEDIGDPRWGSEGGNLFEVFGGVADVSFTHVTSRGNPNSILIPLDAKDVNPRLVFKNNIVERRWYGIGTGSDEGTRTLDLNFPSYAYADNILVNTSRLTTDQAISDSALISLYPRGTWVLSDWSDVGFEPGTSRLASTSRYSRAGDDHKDVGVDVSELETALKGPGGSSCSSSAVAR
jgi:hypothetical protein